MLGRIRKRDGKTELFQPAKIACAINKAASACGGSDAVLAEQLSEQVLQLAERTFSEAIPKVEDIQDIVEKVLIEGGHVHMAKAYILYRDKRANARNLDGLIAETKRMFSNYLGEDDWRVKENANTQKSINGLNNYLRESLIENNWLYEVYPVEVRQAHLGGGAHIHDLGFWGPYCAGWDLRQLLAEGFGGVPGKVESRPAKHLRSFLGQIVNATCTLQGECAGAQAWGNFDTYCAPFIRYDGLTYDQVTQALQEFIFNLNVPTRVGFQCPFSNLTFNLTPPGLLKSQAVVIGGQAINAVYGEFQVEMDLFNRAFCEVMMEGDAKGRVFTFPIPTINVTKDFDWESPAVEGFMKIACKYGIPYFANYLNSDLSPEDTVAMCCRLRVDMTELRQRGGGLFGSNPLTGSIGVFTINLPRIGYLVETELEFKERLRQLVRVGVTSLEIKRKVIEAQTEKGLYPYSAHYLRDIKRKTGQYWPYHFSTIGIVGMNEAALNLFGKDLGSQEGQQFAVEVLRTLRSHIAEVQTETGHFYNLEATPAESTAYRFARLDREMYPDIKTAGASTPYYTNSSQLPVGYSDDIFEVLDLQDELQALYTGGTVLHLYLGESIEDAAVGKRLIRRIFERYKLPYLSLTPTFSICPNHGYLRGEHAACPHCGAEAEIWSRVTGYFRPVTNFNEGKRQEYRDRVPFILPTLADDGA
ncbi:MAG: ribonucleoside triphosphate reductase [Candidatus Hydrogenedentes bacterium]|nr:ribonucleoside triphosphate reductase [Candidatus Hydrogenedentota bacterium]